MNEERSCNKYHHFMRSLANQPNHEQFKGFQKHEEEGWCGPATLQFIARQEGLLYTQSQLARILGTSHEEGTSHLQMFNGAREIGLHPAMIRDATLDILEELLPQYHIIVNWMDGTNEKDDGHYSVLKDVKDAQVYLDDTYMCIDSFNEKWYDIEKEGRVNRWAMMVKRNLIEK